MKYKHLGFAIIGAFFYVVGILSHMMFGRFSFIGVGVAMVILMLSVDWMVKEWNLGTTRIGVRLVGEKLVRRGKVIGKDYE